MPWLKPGVPPRSDHSGFWVPFRFHTSNALKLLDVLTYPCSVVVSGLVVGIAAIVLRPRLGPIAALGPAVAWAAGNATEVFSGHPRAAGALRVGGRHARPRPSSDDSFASGHIMRGIVVAYTLTADLEPRVALGVDLGRARRPRARPPVGPHSERRGRRRSHPACSCWCRSTPPSGGHAGSAPRFERGSRRSSSGSRPWGSATRHNRRHIAGRRSRSRNATSAARRAAGRCLLAAGGDPHRELGVDDRAVRRPSPSSSTPTSAARSSGRGSTRLALLARDLPRTKDAVSCLRPTSTSPGASTPSACSPKSWRVTHVRGISLRARTDDTMQEACGAPS